MPLAPDAVFNGYRIVRALGSGGMGEVYLVEHPRLPRREALKILSAAVSSDPSFQARFVQEADLAAGLAHPNIVRVNDRGEADGQLWISMDYIDGTDAAQLQRDRYPAGMPAAEVAAIVAAVADALDYAHGKGLLHRDVKPANILLSQPAADGARRAFLADFGIARELANPSGLTATNLTVGTVAYASPEQLVGAELDSRSDQYALAATAFHLLTGTPPYQNSNPVAVIGQHLSAPIPHLSTNRPDLADLDAVLARGLAKEPKDRYPRCADFARELAAHGGSGAEASEATQFAFPPASRTDVSRPRKPVGRVMKIVAGGLAAALAVGGGGYLWSRHAQPGSSASSPVAVLEGTYRLDYNFLTDTVMGAAMNPPAPGEPTTGQRWWAFRSECDGSGCVATGTRLADSDHSKADEPAVTSILRFVDGRWISDPEKTRLTNDYCSIDDEGKDVAGFNSAVVVRILEPQPDSTLRASITTTDTSSECGTEGRVVQQHPVATRVGDVPAQILVADPRTAAPPPPERPTTPAPGGAFNGTYRIDTQYTATTIENGKLAAGVADGSEWWAFRSACSDSGCAATGARLDDSNHQEAAGMGNVLQLSDDRWEDVAHSTSIACQWGRGGQNSVTSNWSWQMEPDGRLTGVRTVSVTTNGCGDAGLVSRTPLVAVRVGDVPDSVTLADPALFLP